MTSQLLSGNFGGGGEWETEDGMGGVEEYVNEEIMWGIRFQGPQVV
jgi:hypothetical protein